jgi:hypothetical protein
MIPSLTDLLGLPKPGSSLQMQYPDGLTPFAKDMVQTRNTMQLVRIASRTFLHSLLIVENPAGYCFGGPFALEIATTDNVVACTLNETTDTN